MIWSWNCCGQEDAGAIARRSLRDDSMSAAQRPPRVVPWSCSEEWQEVREALFSDDPTLVQTCGVNVAKMWMLRGKVPSAIENTVALLECCLADRASHLGGFGDDDATEPSSDFVGEKDMPLRLAYTTAIVRFVNEMVDPEQQGVHAQSIMRLAEQIGLPRLLVDIRHEGTHDALPSLEMLRLACSQALDWLEAEYWDRQEHWQVDLIERIRFLLDRFFADVAASEAAAYSASADQLAELGRQAGRMTAQIDYLETTKTVQTMTCQVLLVDFGHLAGHDGFRCVVEQLVERCGDGFLLAMLQAIICHGCLSSQHHSKQLIAWLVQHPAISSDLVERLLRRVVKEATSKTVPLLAHFRDKLAIELSPELRLVLDGLASSGGGSSHRSGKNKDIEMMLQRSRAIVGRHETADGSFDSQSRRLEGKDGAGSMTATEGWSLVDESRWRPCPLGCTPTFHPSIAKGYRSLQRDRLSSRTRSQ